MQNVQGQSYYSWALEPLTIAAARGVPLVLGGAILFAAIRWIRGRGGSHATRGAQRDTALLLVGATAGFHLSWLPVVTFAEGRLGMLLTLPAVGAACGLAASALLPSGAVGTFRIALIESVNAGRYVSAAAWRVLWGACAFTVAVGAFRFILPDDQPLPADVSAAIGNPALQTTRSLYLILSLAGLLLAGLGRAGVSAIVHRSRPSRDECDLTTQEELRGRRARRLVAWTTAALLVLGAAMLTALPRLMGGVVFGDVQLVQRATDVLIVACVIAAGWVIAFGYRREHSAVGPTAV